MDQLEKIKELPVNVKLEKQQVLHFQLGEALPAQLGVGIESIPVVASANRSSVVPSWQTEH